MQYLHSMYFEMMLYKSSLSQIQSRTKISVPFASPQPVTGPAWSQPALFPCIILCKYSITATVCLEHLTT